MAVVRMTAAELVGSAVRAVGAILSVSATQAARLVANGDAVILDTSDSVNLTDLAVGDANAVAIVSLTGTTAKELDLTDLADVADSVVGENNFAAVHALKIQILGTGNLTLTVGNASATQFTGPLGGATHTIAVRPGFPLLVATDAAAGWTTSSQTLLKLAPSATMTVAVSIRGTMA